ncbi:MAG: glycosyltransferase family 2 protein [Muribaculaceae bacterium]|nr:glycosyltransferase family 2 protein [Muribaculaceae bacterium]
MLITVFTPTYNRASLLLRLYDSLKAQTYQDFEWLIVDDGSTDNTEEIITTLLKKKLGAGDIHYIKQPNGGKHCAINRGVQVAKGELFFIADSDDYLPIDSLAKVNEYYQRIKHDKTIGGICGLDVTPSGKIIGSGLPFDDIICSSLELRIRYHVTGDLKEVFYTRVMKEFPFPEYEGERFCPEALVWNRIAQNYKLLFINEPIYIVEYQEEGITARIVSVRMNSPLASVTTYQELNSYDIPFKDKIKAAINYWRFRACVPKGKDVLKLPWYWKWCQPLGFVMHLRDKR